MTTYLQEIKLTLSKTEEHPVIYEPLTTSCEAAKIFKMLFADEIGMFESVFCIYLNQKNTPIGWRKISQGGISCGCSFGFGSGSQLSCFGLYNLPQPPQRKSKTKRGGQKNNPATKRGRKFNEHQTSGPSDYYRKQLFQFCR